MRVTYKFRISKLFSVHTMVFCKNKTVSSHNCKNASKSAITQVFFLELSSHFALYNDNFQGFAQYVNSGNKLKPRIEKYG